MQATLFFDGACRGNPGGLSAGAAVIQFHKPDGELASTLTVHGEVFRGTNNEAEYQGLLVGLQELRRLPIPVREVRIFGDSKLVVSHVRGDWRVKSAHLSRLHRQVKSLLLKFDSWEISWVPREQNTLADRASNEAIDNPHRKVSA